MQRVLYIIRNPPGFIANEIVDMVFIHGIMNSPTTVIFVDEGVYQLTSDRSKLSRKDTAKKWLAAPDYDVDDVFVCQHSLELRSIDVNTLPKFAQLKDESTLKSLMDSTDFVVSD